MADPKSRRETDYRTADASVRLPPTDVFYSWCFRGPKHPGMYHHSLKDGVNRIKVRERIYSPAGGPVIGGGYKKLLRGGEVFQLVINDDGEHEWRCVARMEVWDDEVTYL